MEKLTVKEFIKSADSDMLKEVYAKLFALRLEYEINITKAFDQEFFEKYYHKALETLEKSKLTKFQLCCFIADNARILKHFGFTKQHLLEVAGLNI